MHDNMNHTQLEAKSFHYLSKLSSTSRRRRRTTTYSLLPRVAGTKIASQTDIHSAAPHMLTLP